MDVLVIIILVLLFIYTPKKLFTIGDILKESVEEFKKNKNGGISK